MTQLTDDQLLLLKELEHWGDVLRVQSRFDEYAHLEKVGYVARLPASNVGDIRFHITDAGRAALRSFNY